MIFPSHCRVALGEGRVRWGGVGGVGHEDITHNGFVSFTDVLQFGLFRWLIELRAESWWVNVCAWMSSGLPCTYSILKGVVDEQLSSIVVESCFFLRRILGGGFDLGFYFKAEALTTPPPPYSLRRSWIAGSLLVCVIVSHRGPGKAIESQQACSIWFNCRGNMTDRRPGGGLFPVSLLFGSCDDDGTCKTLHVWRDNSLIWRTTSKGSLKWFVLLLRWSNGAD